ncbi:hypothetical protein AQUCO_00400143v1 [Aquilegia coerulea]|uniref:Uncharacterized protein n=1 Tax=Aquilegia coerulea TaxID=218851 RepID=A0A2G5ETV6_AQUCA|nr:hypothetical protein AQUCO_00400143v1 [Aquilegia coerulea]
MKQKLCDLGNRSGLLPPHLNCIYFFKKILVMENWRSTKIGAGEKEKVETSKIITINPYIQRKEGIDSSVSSISDDMLNPTIISTKLLRF